MAAPATAPERLLKADERSASRKAVVDSGLITVELCPAGFGLMLNVSDTGIGVYTLKNLRPSDVVQVSFMVPGAPKGVECDGEVRWAMDSNAGIRFKHIGPASAANLRTWLRSLPELTPIEQPRLYRREFPLRDEQVRGIEAHIAAEHLGLHDALQFIIARVLDFTNAHGGAIALGDPAQMVCRASAGLAPEIGVQISFTSGVTGECIRTCKTIYCEDTELESRVDREACRELNLRSSLLVPVLRGKNVAGVVEVFSSVPDAFPEDHRWMVKRLAELTGNLALNGGIAAQPQEPVIAPPASAVAPGIQAAPRREEVSTAVPAKVVGQIVDPRKAKGFPSWVRFWPLALLAIIIAVIPFVIARHRSKSVARANTSSVTPPVPLPATTPDSSVEPSQPQYKRADKPHAKPAAESASDSTSESPEPMRKGAEVIALPPSDNGFAADDAPAASAPAIPIATAANLSGIPIPASADVPQLRQSAMLTGGKLLRRVEPQYPLSALRLRIEGDVLLRAHITKTGAIADVRQVTGDPRLGSAAVAAVREWHYEPFRRGNVPQEADVNITVQFKIPDRY